jgi:hypothetical protein
MIRSSVRIRLSASPLLPRLSSSFALPRLALLGAGLPWYNLGIAKIAVGWLS